VCFCGLPTTIKIVIRQSVAMTKFLCLALLYLAVQFQEANSWSSTSASKSLCKRSVAPLRSTTILSGLAGALPEDAAATTTETVAPVETSTKMTTKEQLRQQALKEGGLFTFNTKYGALNPYAIFYGLTSIFLGIFWFAALTAIQFLYFVTGGRVDKRVSRILIFRTSSLEECSVL
jgi:hypothetical protein